jgi:hypothetical protein
MIGMLAAYSFYGDWNKYWQFMVAIAGIAALLIHILFYMFAHALSIKELEVYSKSEILQILATIAMAGFLVFIVNGVQEYLFSSGMVYGEIKCQGNKVKVGTKQDLIIKDMFDVVRCRLQEKALDVAAVQDKVTQGTANIFNYLNLAFSIFGVTVFRGDWDGATYKQVEQIRLTNQLATSMLVSMNAQLFLANYIKSNMLTIFLPVGILLRSFHFTRGAGAFMISLAIGLYFIFPTLFVLLDPGFVKLELPKDLGMKTSAAATPCYPTMAAAVAIITNTPVTSPVVALASGNIKDQLSESYVSLIIHPLVALFLTLAFVRYLMTLLGGDTYELMRMFTKVI